VDIGPDFVFDDGPIVANDAALAPRQTFVVNAYMPTRLLSDEDVNVAMLGIERRLFAWGSVIYEDIFGEEHITKFCHSFMFSRPNAADPKDVKVRSYYHNSHNEME
jgi:hypothetical protein